MSDIQIRDLTTIDEFKQVVELERTIWGYTDNADMVGIPVFIFTVHRGAILIGAFTPDNRMVGFAYAVVGMKGGRPMLWSHMAGVLPEYRGGLGYRLKLAQRERALAQGYDLIEWIAAQPWCTGKVGMIGDSYWSWTQYAAAIAQPAPPAPSSTTCSMSAPGKARSNPQRQPEQSVLWPMSRPSRITTVLTAAIARASSEMSSSSAMFVTPESIPGQKSATEDRS